MHGRTLGRRSSKAKTICPIFILSKIKFRSIRDNLQWMLGWVRTNLVSMPSLYSSIRWQILGNTSDSILMYCQCDILCLYKEPKGCKSIVIASLWQIFQLRPQISQLCKSQTRVWLPDYHIILTLTDEATGFFNTQNLTAKHNSVFFFLQRQNTSLFSIRRQTLIGVVLIVR